MNLQALLLENQNIKAQIVQQAQSFKAQISQLEEQLEWFKRQLFGTRSEKNVEHPDQLKFDLGLEEPEEVVEEQKIAQYIRKTYSKKDRYKLTFPDDLPVETQVLDLKEEQKYCPKTNTPLVKIGEEVSRKLAYRPGSYYIKEIIRPKYALPQNAGVLVESLPDTLLSRSQADESLLADIFTKKFADHLPLYRISEIFLRDGIAVSRQLLSQWVLRCGKALIPLYDELRKSVLKSQSLHVDETPIDMQMPGKGKMHQGYMWVLVSGGSDPPLKVYSFKKNRKHSNAVDLLMDYSGVVHSDKYGAYEKLANQKQFIWSPCWAHIRRKFIEAESGDLAFRSWVLRKIRYLFMLERVAWGRSPQERLKIRREKELLIIDELIAKIKEKLISGKVLPKSKFREALGYFCGLIPHLKNYLKHAEARLDNNRAERAIRPLAIGRKNWLCVGSEEGGLAAAVLLSLVQSCRSIGVNPRAYLEDVMRRLMGHSAQKLDELLPLAWANSKNIKINQHG